MNAPDKDEKGDQIDADKTEHKFDADAFPTSTQNSKRAAMGSSSRHSGGDYGGTTSF